MNLPVNLLEPLLYALWAVQLWLLQQGFVHDYPCACLVTLSLHSITAMLLPKHPKQWVMIYAIIAAGVLVLSWLAFLLTDLVLCGRNTRLPTRARGYHSEHILAVTAAWGIAAVISEW